MDKIRDLAGGHDTHHMQPVVGHRFGGVTNSPKFAVQRVFDILLKVDDRELLTFFHGRQRRDVALGDQVAAVHQSQDADVLSFDHFVPVAVQQQFETAGWASGIPTSARRRPP